MWGSCTLPSFISLKSAFYILYIHTFNLVGKENGQYIINTTTEMKTTTMTPSQKKKQKKKFVR